MLRILRLLGILLFAMLIGISASSLQGLHQDGTLFERYNSQRKSNITLLVVSIFSLASLGYFEFRSRRWQGKRGYRSVRVEEDPGVDGLDSTSIYSAPETIDQWEGRRTRTSKTRHRQPFDGTGFWMGLLRIYCIVLPVVYLYTLLNYLFLWLPSGAGHLFLTILFPILFLASALMSVGTFRKKIWGINFGYGIAIFHLLIFPVGTIAGLFLLVGLVGSSSEFAIPAREKRRLAREAKRKQMQVA